MLKVFTNMYETTIHIYILLNIYCMVFVNINITEIDEQFALSLPRIRRVLGLNNQRMPKMVNFKEILVQALNTYYYFLFLFHKF